MRKNLLFVISIAVFSLLFSSIIFAQDNKVISAAGEMYVISARAGGVNDTEGEVSIFRQNGKSGLLLKSDQIEIGDKISTGASSKAEILLNPGSFVRLASNSKFEFASTDLEDLRLKLLSGSAIFEVYADKDFKVSLALPAARIEFTNSGVYRVDVLADGSGNVSVWKGKVEFDGEDKDVKSGKSAIVKGDSVTIAKFDRDNKDELVLWSQLRAKEAARINARLQRNTLSNSLVTSYNRGGWDMFNTFGVWVFDSFSRRWCFLPFGMGWSSPYGYSYGFNVWRCRLPQYVYQQPQTTTNTVNPNTVNSNNTARTPRNPNTVTSDNTSRTPRNTTPSFQKFERNQPNVGGGWINDGRVPRDDMNNGGWNNTRSRDNNNAPVFSPSTPSNSSERTPSIMPSRIEKAPKDN